MIDCLRSFWLVKLGACAHLVALSLISMMLCYVTVRNCHTSRPYRDAQDRLLWREKTCPAPT